tara:strand:+ start:23 stop:1009 length:987 start_codon:yes stop_codon:yes gene_type:complete
MVKDKINYRAQGPRTVLTRQTVQGRANDGGLRIGEMERDCIIAHGATNFLQESMLVRGDNYYLAICNNTGSIAIYNENKNLFLSPMSDGPLKFNNNLEGEQNIEVISKFGRSFSIIRVPYSFKLLMQELQVMNIQMRIITEDNIDQLTNFNFTNTINKIKEISMSKIDKSIIEKKIKPKTIVPIDLTSLTKKQTEEPQEEEEEEEEEDKEIDDEEGLSDATIESIKKAEQDYEKYKLEEDEDEDEDEDYEKPPINIGETIDQEDLGIEDLTDESIKLPETKSEDIPSSEKSLLEVSEEPLEKSESQEQEQDQPYDSSAKRKTIKIADQ